MKFLCSILIWISLGFGAVAAITAYMPPTSLSNDAFRAGEGYLKTTAPLGPMVDASEVVQLPKEELDESESSEDAGKAPEPAAPGSEGTTDEPVLTQEPGEAVESQTESVQAEGDEEAQEPEQAPMFPEGTELTPENLAKMRKLDEEGNPLVSRVKVKDFAFDRWTHKYVFLGAMGGLLVGGIGTRVFGKPAASDDETPAEETPEGSLAAAIGALESLMAKLESEPDDDARLSIILDEIGEVQQTHFAVFADSREVLIARMGLGRYAAVMDRFATGERAANRAWSAAADGRAGAARDVPDMLAESEDNIATAVDALTEARDALG